MTMNLFRRRNCGIDLGNNNTLVGDVNGLLISQPSYIAFDTINNHVRAVGDEAYSMFEKTHSEVRPVKPLRGGVIADYDSAYKMIAGLVKKAHGSMSPFNGYDHVVSGIPYNTTEVERRALRDALEQFNARKTHLLFEPLAAAMGMGLNVREPDGKMVIDIGGGITEIVVISLSGIAAFQSIKVAGDAFDGEIQDYFRRNYNMAIGSKTAEQIKIRVGAVQSTITENPTPIQVKGKDLIEGIPTVRSIDHHEVSFILDKSISAIEHAIIQTLETCPPELAADIYQNGLHVTGGNALLRGLKERFEARIKLPVHIDSEALLSVSKGVQQVLCNENQYKGVLLD